MLLAAPSPALEWYDRDPRWVAVGMVTTENLTESTENLALGVLVSA
jgi:hypothetical protein